MSEGGLPSGLRVRAGVPGDAPAIASLVAAAFATYRDWAEKRYVLRADAATAGELRWVEAFTQEDRRTTVTVEPRGRMVGITSWRGARDPHPDGEPVPGVAHLSALFVHPERHREGIGAALLELAEQQMRDDGFASAQLWAVEGAPSVDFYAAHGWTQEGRRDIFPEFVDPAPMLLFVRSL